MSRISALQECNHFMAVHAGGQIMRSRTSGKVRTIIEPKCITTYNLLALHPLSLRIPTTDIFGFSRCSGFKEHFHDGLIALDTFLNSQVQRSTASICQNLQPILYPPQHAKSIKFTCCANNPHPGLRQHTSTMALSKQQQMLPRFGPNLSTA